MGPGRCASEGWRLSAFVTFHVAATVVWVMPLCPIRNELSPWFQYYIVPLGLWQSWAMFAPDPVPGHLDARGRGDRRERRAIRVRLPPAGRLRLVAGDPPVPLLEVRGQSRLRGILPGAQASPRITCSGDWSCPPTIYPVSVHLFYQDPEDAPARQAAPPAVDLMTPTKPIVIATFRTSIAASEVQPMNPLREWNRVPGSAPSSKARPLGAFRVAFGLLVLAYLGFLVFDIDYWYTGIGMLPGTEARELAGPLRFSPLQWVQDPTSVRLFFAATAVVGRALHDRLADARDGHPHLPGDALDHPPQHPDEQRSRHPVADHVLLHDVAPTACAAASLLDARRATRGGEGPRPSR